MEVCALLVALVVAQPPPGGRCCGGRTTPTGLVKQFIAEGEVETSEEAAVAVEEELVATVALVEMEAALHLG